METGQEILILGFMVLLGMIIGYFLGRFKRKQSNQNKYIADLKDAPGIEKYEVLEDTQVYSEPILFRFSAITILPKGTIVYRYYGQIVNYKPFLRIHGKFSNGEMFGYLGNLYDNVFILKNKLKRLN